LSRGSVAVVHPFLCIMGGGEFLALVAARVLKDSGYDVTMYTLTEVPLDDIKRFLGVEFRIPIKLLNYRIDRPITEILWGSSSRKIKLLMSFELAPLIEELWKEHDVVFDTQSDLVLPCDVRYLHYPWLVPDGFEDPSYLALYNATLHRIKDLLRRSRVLTNSSWTAAKILRSLGIFAEVLHPPVKVREIVEACRGVEKDPKLVVTISRFAPDKKVDTVVRIASLVRDMKFVIMGSLSAESRKVLEQVRVLMEEMGLDNVELRPNASRKDLVGTLCRASIYLHPAFAEHFGIAVVEAMAAGAVPVVFRDGGTWHDIVSLIDQRLGYQTIEEAAQVIQMLRTRELWTKLSRRSRALARKFDIEAFARRIVEVIDVVTRIRRIAKRWGAA